MNFQKLFLCLTLFFISQMVYSQTQRRESNKQKKGGFPVTINGIVIDEESKLPLEFATVSIYNKKDSSIVTGGLTDLDGKYNLSCPSGDYFAKVEFISYNGKVIDPVPFSKGLKNLDLGVISLSPASEILDDIEITAERSETVFALDKKVFNVGKDLANRGGSAEDVLDNVPSVTVDIDGNVSLRGSEGVRILIDGRPSGLAGVGNTNGLKNIPSNLIEKVEVITNPSARYEAEGMAGIINIILKKNQLGGFNGSFDVTTGIPSRAGVSANVNYRKGKLNWFLNYGINTSKNPGGGFRIQDQTANGANGELERQLSIQDRDQNRSGVSNSIRFGTDYFFNDKEQLTGSFLYRKSDDNNLTTLRYEDYKANITAFDSEPLWTLGLDALKKLDFDDFTSQVTGEPLFNISERTDEEKEDEENLEYSLNYRKEYSSREHTLNASIQFRENTEVESSLFGNSIIFNSLNMDPLDSQRSNNDEGQKTWQMQLDFVRPLGKDHKYELGIRSSLREIRNDFLVEDEIDGTWTRISELSNDFIYNEDVLAAYAIYGNSFEKFSYQLGLRSEYSIINTQLLQAEVGGTNKRTYNNLFPSGHINYNFSESSALQLSYSRRIRRPRFWDLNPFFTFSDNRNFFSGNPNLNPEFTDSYELGQIMYWDKLSLSSSLFHRITNSSMQRILVIDNETTNTLRMPFNIGTFKNTGLDVSVSYSGLKWLRLDYNMNIFRNQLKLDQGDISESVFNTYQVVRNYSDDYSTFQNQFGVSLNEIDNIIWTGRITARLTFWDSDLQIRGNYRGPRESSQGSRGAVGSIDLGWSKDFLSNRMTATISVRDLINSRKRNGVTLLDDFVDKSEFQWRSRSATLTLSYRINQKKKRGGNRQGGGNQEGGEF